ncbi:MAG: TolC family protein [Desulfovibrio sp.]|nr:TolC family protein [Desulfovibrio sp.]
MNKAALVLAAILLAPLPAHAERLANSHFPPPPAPGASIKVEDTVYGVMRVHRTLRGIQENRDVLEHELDRARAGFGPRVDVEAAGGWGILSDSTTRARDLDDNYWGQVRLSAKLVQPIWDGFATRSRVRAAQATLDSVKHRVFDNATSLSLDGIIAHINLLRCRHLLQLAQDNVSIHERILGQAKDRAAVGADTQADESQAQSRYQRALSTLEEYKDNLRVAEDTFTRLTGLPAEARLEPVSMPPEIYKDTKTVFDEALQSNPKLEAYMKDVKVQTANRELARAAFFPTINFEAGPNYPARVGGTDRWTYSFDVLFTLRWNIFNSGADVAEYKAGSARIRQARQIYYNFIDDLKLDIDTTWSNYLAAQEQYKHYTQAMEYNKFTLNAYNEQFLIGQRTLLDVLDSENELFNSSSQAETAKSNVLIGAWRMLALSGRMLPKMNIDCSGLEKAPPVDPEDSREVFEAGWFN